MQILPSKLIRPTSGKGIHKLTPDKITPTKTKLKPKRSKRKRKPDILTPRSTDSEKKADYLPDEYNELGQTKNDKKRPTSA